MSWSRLLLSVNGRIPRRSYWIGFGALLITCIVVDAALPIDALVKHVPLEEARAHPYAMLTPIAYAELAIVNWVAFAIGAKRCHDRDQSAWYLLIFFIPIVGAVWIWIELGGFRGTPGANRFGPDPLVADAIA